MSRQRTGRKWVGYIKLEYEERQGQTLDKVSKEREVALIGKIRAATGMDGVTLTRQQITLKEEAAPPPEIPEEDVAARIILLDGSHHIVTNQQMEHYRELYPAVAVEQEMRNLAGWCEANPKQRKTKCGIERCIHSWLKKEQNRPAYAKPATKKANDTKQPPSYNISEFEKRAFEAMYGNLEKEST